MEKVLCPIYENGSGNHRNSEGDIIEYAPGKLLFAYTNFYMGGSDFGPGNIMAKRSEDDGETWSEPFVLLKNEAAGNTGRLGLFMLNRKQFVDAVLEPEVPEHIGLIYVNLNVGYPGDILISVSGDHGNSWTPGRSIVPAHRKFLGTPGLLNGVARRLKSGRIIVPVYEAFDYVAGSFFLYSDDNTFTWQRSQGTLLVPIRDENNALFGAGSFVEPTIAELADGRLLCHGRTMMGQIYRSFSSDGGITWSEPEPTGLASSYSPGMLREIPGTNDILCVWNHVSGQETTEQLGRARLSCAISSDGIHWRNFKNIESMDDITSIEPPEIFETIDGSSERTACKNRTHAYVGGADEVYPKEVAARYPRWPGYTIAEYPAITFTQSGKVIICYDVVDSLRNYVGSGYKIRIEPISWLYE